MNGYPAKQRRQRRFSRAAWILMTVGLAMGMTNRAHAQALPAFDFTRAEDVRGWEATHDVSRLQGTAEGLAITISGSDPYITGPPRDFPLNQRLWMRLRLKSDQAGQGQVFYFRTDATEANSVRFPVRAGVWEEIQVPLPPLGPRFRLRFDPPGTSGQAVLAWLRFDERVVLTEPAWPVPSPPALDQDSLTLQSGDLQLLHARKQLGGFVLKVAGQSMAVGLTRPLIGYLQGGQERWLAPAESATVAATPELDAAGHPAALTVAATLRDPDGAAWEIRQRFGPATKPGAIDVETRVTVSQERSVIFLPMLVLLPGVGSFGPAKGQGLFAGLEYLENEASSSEADLIGPASHRQVPDSEKITFPLMAIQEAGRYVGLVWEKDAAFSALFDSPDRRFHSGGHVMGVLFPGSDGANRVEGSLLPSWAETLPAGTPLVQHATLIGGRGETVVPAVQQYVALRGLPPLPDVGLDRQSYVALAAGGWLDSRLREGSRYRHAYWPGGPWTPQAAPDAAALMEWLAQATADAGLAQRLRTAAAAAVAQAAPGEWNTAGVSHVRYPVPSLVYGEVAANASRALEIGRGFLGGFQPDGTLLYAPAPNSPDFGSTHFAPDASGYTASVVEPLLQAATVCGDPRLIDEGLRVLRALDGFAGTVPRGAQTWEIPLHTPDILAAAHLVRAYTLGYELTGEPHFLEQARYWAWTGVPFLYLAPPVPERIGTYATIPVLGASNWRAPVWMGQPVQWCGLVYADALYRFARHDPGGPWKQLADGITASGIQQSWPADDAALQGLLPDSFEPHAQIRNGAAINPGTVEANAIRFFGGPPLYDFASFLNNGLLVHAPGAIVDPQEQPGRVAFTVQGWSPRPYFLLVVGLKGSPRVRINGHETPLTAPHQYIPSSGRLILQVSGSPTVEISLP
jgi:hypothetical protein